MSVVYICKIVQTTYLQLCNCVSRGATAIADQNIFIFTRDGRAHTVRAYAYTLVHARTLMLVRTTCRTSYPSVRLDIGSRHMRI